MSEAKKATSKTKHRDGARRDGQSHNISTKKVKSSSKVKVKPNDPASPADKLILLSGTSQVEVDKSDIVEDFFNLPKYKSKTPPWPKSDVEGWNLTIGSIHTVQIMKNMSDTEFPLSKFPAWIQLSSKKAQEYKDMWKELQSIYTSVLGSPEALVVTQDPEKNPWKGQFVVIWHTDVKRFSRAVVKRGGTEDGTFIVLSIDFKRFIPVHKKHMYLMCSKFMGLRPRAVFLHMDSVHYFSRSPALQKLISSLTLSPSEIDFISSFAFVVTRHETDKFIFGDLFRNSESLRLGEKSVNILFMEKLWVNAPPPSLPKLLNEGRLQCFVVHAEKGGTVYLQLTSPIWHALQDYIDVAEKKLEAIQNLQIESELEKYKVTRLVDPKIIYMLHYKNIHHSELPLESDDDGSENRHWDHRASTSRSKSFKFYRVQVALNQGEKKKSLEKPGKFSRVLWADVVRFKFIDFGFEETINITEHFLVKSMKLHPFLDKIPPQAVKTRLANIATLDVDRFYKEVISDSMSVYILTVAAAEGDDLSQVLLYTSKKTENPLIDDFAKVNDYLIKDGIAQPSAASNKVLEIKPQNGKRASCTQLEYIEMKDTTDWGDNYNSSTSASKPQPVVPLNFHFKDPTMSTLGIDSQLLRKGEKILFFVGDDTGKCYFGKTWKHFVIRTVYAKAQIRKYSTLISDYVSKPWILAAMRKKMLTKNYLNTGWFYSFHSFQKGCFVRARLLSDVPILPIAAAASDAAQAQAGSSSSATGVDAVTGNNSVEPHVPEPGISVRMLLIDYAEEVEVPIKDLFLSIPLNVCGIGPMAAKVACATLDNSEPLALLKKTKGNHQITGPRFQDRFTGKKCTAIVKRVEYDRFGVAKLHLDRMKLAPSASAGE